MNQKLSRGGERGRRWRRGNDSPLEKLVGEKRLGGEELRVRRGRGEV